MSKKIKFAVNENTIFQCDLIDYLSACRTAGINAVEISYAKLNDALRFVPAGKLKSACKGIEILSLNAFEDVFLVPDENLKALESEAVLIGELCSLIECPAVIAPSGRWYPEYGELPEENEIIKRYKSRFSIVKEKLDAFNIETMFEPINFPEFILGTPDSINKFLAPDEFSDVRIVPDIHNLHYNGLGPEQLLDIKAEIGLFHIDDTPDIPRSELRAAETRAFPGDGVADASEWVNRSKQKGYVGYYSLELFDKQIYAMEPDKAAFLCREKLDKFASKL